MPTGNTMRDIPIKTPENLDDFINLAERFRKRPDNLFRVLVALVARGVDLDAPLDGQTVMCRALATQRVWLVEALLQAGADPMAPARDGVPAFRMAVAWNETQAALAMLETGRVDIQQVDSGGASALHDTAQNGNEHLMQAFLTHGARGFEVNQNGESALDIFERGPASHANHDHKRASQKILDKMDSMARAGLLEGSLPPPSVPLRPKGRF